MFLGGSELTSVQGFIDINVVPSLLLKSIKLKIENIVIFYKNFFLKNQQYMLMIDNIRNIGKSSGKNKAPILSQPREPNHC